jgi:DNA-binding NarL/FixJ family response regulator
MNEPVIRVVIADDHELFRDGLRGLLNDHGGVEVVGEAATGEEAVQIALTEQPDVVIMDLYLPDLDGVAATRTILAHAPEIAVLMLTMFEADE